MILQKVELERLGIYNEDDRFLCKRGVSLFVSTLTKTTNDYIVDDVKHKTIYSVYDLDEIYLLIDEEVDVARGFSALAWLDLNNAYKNAKDNVECAKILRLYLTDGKEFCRMYGTHVKELNEKLGRKPL